LREEVMVLTIAYYIYLLGSFLNPIVKLVYNCQSYPNRIKVAHF